MVTSVLKSSKLPHNLSYLLVKKNLLLIVQISISFIFFLKNFLGFQIIVYLCSQ